MPRTGRSRRGAAALALALSVAPATAAGQPWNAATSTGAAGRPTARRAMVQLPGGSYRPLYEQPGAARVSVAAFRLDRDPATRREFQEFVRSTPQWSRVRVPGVFADRGTYLADWRGELDAGDAAVLDAPVVNVSWFAARAYCEWRGARLPTVHEWEYAAAASDRQRDASRDPAHMQHLVSLYATRPRPVQRVSAASENAYGLRGMHGYAWEWVEDFNSVLVSDDSRGVGAREHAAYCASAAIGAVDPSNYAAFLRFAVRAGLSGRGTMETLGFRCAA